MLGLAINLIVATNKVYNQSFGCSRETYKDLQLHKQGIFLKSNFVTRSEGPLHNTIIFTTGLEMIFTVFIFTRKTNTILHKVKLGFEKLAPALHT